MTPRQLTYFVNIADLGSFTRASAALYVAQPALSRQMQLLEEDLGVKLFKRTESGVALTEAGALLRERAGALLNQLRQVRDEVSAMSPEPQGRLHLGMPPSLFDLATVPIVAAYRSQYPRVELAITEGVSLALHHMVLDGRLDVAVLAATEPLSTLVSVPLVREQLYLIARPEDPVAVGLDVVPLSRLEGLPLVVTQHPNAMRLIAQEALKTAGITTVSVLECNSSRLIAAAVACGVGYSVVPYSGAAAEVAAGRLQAVPVEGLSVTWQLVHSRERILSTAAERFRVLFNVIAARQIDDSVWKGCTTLG
jgi:LysR family nitrogen assimilation transcriptional regulator